MEGKGGISWLVSGQTKQTEPVLYVCKEMEI